MKLRELAIDGYGVNRNLSLGRFGDGLSVVYGENGAGKSSCCNFIRASLLGKHTSLTNPTNGFSFDGGRLNITDASEEIQITQDRTTNQLNLHSITNPSNYPSLQQLTGNVSDQLFDTVFNVRLRDTALNAPKLANVLRFELDVLGGTSAAGDDSAYQAWQRESTEINLRCETIKQRMEELSKERTEIHAKTKSLRLSYQANLEDIDQKIKSVTDRLSALQHVSQHEQLVLLDQQIAQLRLMIENARTRVAHIPPTPTIDANATLYLRLDEIDNQIRRWRLVQSDIQKQRVRLRDEMLVWNELTLESDAHPYHTAREILVSLEGKVDQAARSANHWRDAGGPHVDTTQMAESLSQLCRTMRDDLYGLCNELGQQYKHIRHKAAAAELKQLRRCYTEMGESINGLLKRRESVINEIASVDPAGAQAITRAEAKFCECAHHKGYLEARRRFIGNLDKVAPIQPTYEVIEPNLDSEKAKLAALEQQRSELLATTSRIDAEVAELNRQHIDLIAMRDALALQSNQALQSRLVSIDVELGQLSAELNSLVSRQTEFIPTPPNPLIQRACNYLTQVTEGELTQVFLNESNTHSDIQVRDRIGKVLNFSALDAGRQAQTYLSLILAAKIELSRIELPTIIDDAFDQVSAERAFATLKLLHDVATQNVGQQIIVTTQHRYLADRIPGIPVYEIATTPNVHTYSPPKMPVSFPVTTAYVHPLPEVPVQHETWQAESVYTTDAYYTSQQPRSYPLTKYPRSKPGYGLDDRSYTITYPFAQPNIESEQFERELYGSPIINHPPKVAAVRVSEVAEPISMGPSIDDLTGLEKTALFDANQLRIFADNGILVVADLLAIDINSSNLFGFRVEQVDQWQAQVWLLSNVPGLRIVDAQVLVACGVTEPEQLETSHAAKLVERIHRYISNPSGKRFASAQSSFTADRIGSWQRAIGRTRSRWSTRSRQSYRQRSRTDRQYEPRERERYERTRAERNPREYQRHDRDYGDRENRRSNREPREARPPRMNVRAERSAAEQESVTVGDISPVTKLTAAQKPRATRTTRPKKSKSSSKSTAKLKFYLDLSDHVEAAPSIGPKTAERFEKIGVHTVSDLLKQTAESMAGKIAYKRISAEVIRDWQQQARLVCRVPNLRGHDAQLLVACGVTEPEDLSTMQPANLIDVIGPFSETKEGLKIIRNGKKPDLEEITDWISWAQHTRSLQAA